MGLNVKLSFTDDAVLELAGEDVSVIRVEFWQAISELYTLTVRLRARASHIELREVVGKVAELGFFKDDKHAIPATFLPKVRGVVRRAHQLSVEETGMSTYEIVIVPPQWLTSLRSVCQIFNEKTAPEVADAIVKKYHKAGILVVNRPIMPPSPTRKREYIVQYNEEDLHLIRRVLAEEGIAFFYEGEALEQWRLSHDTSVLSSKVLAELPLLPAGGAIRHNIDAVLAVEFGPALRPGRQHLRDYRFDNPFFHPTGERQDDGAFELVSLLGRRRYEEGILHEQQGAETVLMSDAARNHQAQMRLEGERRDHDTLVAELNCPLPAGARLMLTGDHPAAGREHLVVRAVSVLVFSDDADTVSVTHSHRVACIPASHPYRPPLLPKPRIHGIQRATVAGTEEIDVDEHGRVLVVFQWDDRARFEQWKGPPETTEPETLRISVAQDWAGPTRGFLTLPRLGDEVAVAYIDGDPDEPIIIGRLYNGRNRAAVKLPDDRTQSVWRSCSSPNGDGFHEIRFEDKLGSEELHIEAERLHTRLVKGDEDVCVGGNRTIAVGGDHREEIVGNMNITVDGDIYQQGANHSINGLAMAEVACTEREEHSAQHSIYTENMLIDATGQVVTSTGLFGVHSGMTSINATGSITLQVGGSSIVISGGSISINAPVVNINS